MTPQTIKLLQDRLAIVPEEVSKLILSGEIELIVIKLKSDFSLSDVQAAQLSNEIVLTVLFFYPTSTLTKRVIDSTNVAPDIATSIYNSVDKAIFAPLKSIYDMLPATDKENKILDTVQEKEVIADTQKDLTSDIAETEATLKAIPHVRTMAEDMKQSQAAKETTYSSTQEAILKEGRPTVDKTSPQWGNIN